MTPSERESFVAGIRTAVEFEFAGENLGAACLYWALATAEALHRRGERVCVQAGTLEWPCVAHDDGVSPTHFSYAWEPGSEATRERVAQDLMPEVHCWVALPDSGEVVDLSTKYLRAQAARLGVQWTGSEPPDYLWATAAELPDGVRYVPCLEAIKWLLGQVARAGRNPADVIRWGLG